MSEFDDPQFEHALGRLSGGFPDDNAALGAVHHRVQQVRRRRTLVVSTTASLLLITGVGVVAARGVHHDPLRPGASIAIDDTTTAHTATTPDRTTPDSTATTASTTPDHATSTAATPVTTTTAVVVVTTGRPVSTGGSPTTVPVAVVPTTTHAGSGTGGPPSTSSTSSTSPSTSTTVAAPSVHTYSTPGGSFTVRFADGRLTLLGTVVTAGFHIDSQTVEPLRIEFRFRGPGGADFRTRVEVKDGALVVTH